MSAGLLCVGSLATQIGESSGAPDPDGERLIMIIILIIIIMLLLIINIMATSIITMTVISSKGIDGNGREA